MNTCPPCYSLIIHRKALICKGLRQLSTDCVFCSFFFFFSSKKSRFLVKQLCGLHNLLEIRLNFVRRLHNPVHNSVTIFTGFFRYIFLSEIYFHRKYLNIIRKRIFSFYLFNAFFYFIFRESIVFDHI